MQRRSRVEVQGRSHCCSKVGGTESAGEGGGEAVYSSGLEIMIKGEPGRLSATALMSAVGDDGTDDVRCMLRVGL